MRKTSFLFLILFVIACKKNTSHDLANIVDYIAPIKKDHQIREVKKAVIVPNVDGKMDDPIWKEALWYSIDQKWMGAPYTFQDFFGRYKMVWTPESLYILAEIKDDILSNQNKNPLELWWNDDSIGIFIDADNSGGEYQYSNNCFNYNVALDRNVADFDLQKKPILYNNHITCRRITTDNVSVWEMEIIVYDHTYKEGEVNDALVLMEGQKLGFAIAYNDNDTSTERELMIGSVFIPSEDENKDWSNADVFGTIILKE